MKWGLLIVVVCLAGCRETDNIHAKDSRLNSVDIKSGYVFLQADTKALQDDDFANPGFLWVDRGERLFQAAEGGELEGAGIDAPVAPSVALGHGLGGGQPRVVVAADRHADGAAQHQCQGADQAQRGKGDPAHVPRGATTPVVSTIRP